MPIIQGIVAAYLDLRKLVRYNERAECLQGLVRWSQKWGAEDSRATVGSMGSDGMTGGIC